MTKPAKGAAKQLARTPKQQAAIEAARKKQAIDAESKAAAQRLAQIVNLHIAGYSLAEIGLEIGSSAEEVDRMLASDAQRYIRSQPALRVFVRNWVSERYTQLLDAVWDDATDKSGGQKLTANGFDRKLASQDRAIKILDLMSKLHGAQAPAQTEIKVEAAPEAVDRLVQALAANQGQGYDVNIFDVIEGEIVHEAAAAGFPETAVGSEEPSAYGVDVRQGDEDFG